MSNALRKILAILLAVGLTFSTLLTFTSCGEETSNGESASQSSQAVYSLTADQTAYTIKEGSSKQLGISLYIDGVLSNTLDGVSFVSLKPEIATVDQNGVVTGVSRGTTTVRATIGNAVKSFSVTVSEIAKDLVLSASSFYMSAGQTTTVSAQAYLGGNIDKNAVISFQIEDTSVATIDENGVITAVKNGSTNLIATYKTVTVNATIVVYAEVPSASVNSFDEEFVNTYGRAYIADGKLNLDHVSSAVEVAIIGTSLTVNLKTNTTLYIRVFVDDKIEGERIKLTSGSKAYQVASNLKEGYHKIRIVKCSELYDGQITVESFTAEKFATIPQKGKIRIEFIGDSITAGYAVLGAPGATRTVANSDGSKSFAYQTAQLLNADYSTIAVQGICAVAYHWQTSINMYDLYQTVSAKEYNSAKYDFSFNPDIVVLALGTNESSYLSTASAYASQFPNDYKSMLELIREKNPNAHILCIYGMMGNVSTISSGIQTAVASLGDSKISYAFLSANTLGGAGHPSQDANTAWANELAKKIQKILEK